MEPRDLFAETQRSPVPKSESDWTHLLFSARNLFTPHTPIDEKELFAGRINLIDRLTNVVFQNGQHAVLFGERGVGKSSLANIVKEKIFGGFAMFKVIKRNCTKDHDFKLIWQQVFSEYDRDGVSAGEWLERNHNPFDVYELITALAGNDRLIIIIDEFDRVTDEETKVLMADTVKYLSDYGVSATLVIVGVARDVAQLFTGHASVSRAIDHIPMPKMEPPELTQILDVRLRLLNLSIDPETKTKIIGLSQGLPGLTHLLGQAAAVHAIEDRRLNIGPADLDAALKVAIERSEELVEVAYMDAVRSTKPGNQYRQALLACALAESDSRGYFSAASIRAPFTEIMGRQKDIPSFARHLNEFCKAERGPVLEKRGQPRSYEYCFANPLLRPYVVIRGISEGLMETDDLKL